MKAAAFLVSLIVSLVAIPAHATDGDDLSTWPLKKLCKKTDKIRHADAVLAEIERRNVFTPFELELVRSGGIDLGMGAAALQCSWGEPDDVSLSNGALQRYRAQIDGQQRTVIVHVKAGQVTNIYALRAGYNEGGTQPSVYEMLHSDRLLSGRDPSVPFGSCGSIDGSLDSCMR